MIYYERSQPAPPCLEAEKAKASGSHDCEDVRSRLKADFKNKCYLCGSSRPISSEIDHLRPHHQGKFRDLMFDWNNLFFSCRHCNLTKGTREGILDCTQDAAIDTKIRPDLEGFPKEKITFAAQTPIAEDTASLLHDIFNGTLRSRSREDSASLRELLSENLNKFYEQVVTFLSSTTPESEKQSLREWIIIDLLPSSPFTAFKRWIIRDNPVLMAEFGQYLA